MSNQVYSRYLYQMLMEFGYVCIPSLGTFYLQYEEAALSKDKSKVNPPNSVIRFDQSETKMSFKELLSESGMSVFNAENIQNSIIADYYLSLKSEKPFVLSGLGQVDSGGFQPSDPRYFNQYDGLEPIIVKPIPQSITHDEAYTYGLNGMSQTKSKPSKVNYILPGIIGLISFSFLLYMFLNKEISNKTLPSSLPTSPVEQELISDIDTNNSIDYSQVDSITEEIISNEPEKDVTSPMDKKVPSTEIEAQKQNDNTSCVVIVGAFKDTANANRLLKSIASSGYKTYTADFDGFRRVGVAYNCENTNPEAFKLKVRKQFNKDAWHLHDTL